MLFDPCDVTNDILTITRISFADDLRQISQQTLGPLSLFHVVTYLFFYIDDPGKHVNIELQWTTGIKDKDILETCI